MKKKILLFGSGILLLLSVLLLTPHKKEDIYLENNKLNNSLGTMAYYVENEEGAFINSSSLPGQDEGYVLDEVQSICDGDAIIKWDNGTWSANITNINKENITCYLYFKKYVPLTAEQALAKLEDAMDSQYEIIEQTTFEGTSSSTDKVLYKLQDNDGDTYVFRGNPDNWVTFANKTWRIIRINGDGTLRLLYYCGDTTCSSPTNAASSNPAYKTSPYNDNTYVGYYYGTPSSSSYETTHKSLKDNKSTIAGVVNTWYEDNLKNNYAEKLSGASGWCNDRTISTIKPSGYEGNGTGTNASVYGAWGRFVDGSSSSWTTKTPVTPKLTCEQNDLFTTTSDKNGNQILDYPIGLITADEVIIGGMLYYGNSSYYETQSYVSASFYYWTMSPYYTYSSGRALVFRVNSDGCLDGDYVYRERGVRPVINVNLDKVTITGKGTSSSRFAIT